MATDETHESQGIVGLGTKVKVKESGASGSYVLVGEPTDINGPQISQQFADFTHMQSPAGYQEQKPTFKSSGQLTFNVHRVPGDPGQEMLIEATNTIPTKMLDVQIEFPDASEFEFKAYPGLSFTVPMSGAFDMAVTLTITGPVKMEYAGD